MTDIFDAAEEYADRIYDAMHSHDDDLWKAIYDAYVQGRLDEKEKGTKDV